MESTAQAGLEYLMTYGWALVLIVTLVAALVFVVGEPQEASFSSSDPGKIMVKQGGVSGNEAEIVMQNITGGVIKIRQINVTCAGSGCAINGQSFPPNQTISPTIDIPAGGELHITGILHTGAETVSIQYTDFAGLDRSVNVGVSGGEVQAGVCTDTGDCESGEFCCSGSCVPDGTCLGPELVLNGGFANSDNWTTGPIWNISSGYAEFSMEGDTDDLSQDVGLTVGDAGKTYRLQFDISGPYTGGDPNDGLLPILGGTNGTLLTADLGEPVVQDITVLGAGPLIFRGISVLDLWLQIDNVSVKEVLG